MSYSIQEISNYFFYSLIPIYSLLIINVVYLISFNSKSKNIKNKISFLIINILSILGTGSHLIFQGVLSDNLINMKFAFIQTVIILCLLILILFFILISIIKIRNKK